MANTNLAGEKSDVKIHHASIASGNLSLMSQPSRMKSSLGKKKSRHNEEKKNETTTEKKPNNEDQELNKSDKSNL